MYAMTPIPSLRGAKRRGSPCGLLRLVRETQVSRLQLFENKTRRLSCPSATRHGVPMGCGVGVGLQFNSSEVLRERASLMEQHEGLTYERDAMRREPFVLRSSYFVNELTDDLSIAMMRRIKNRYGVEIWPWERSGFPYSK